MIYAVFSLASLLLNFDSEMCASNKKKTKNKRKHLNQQTNKNVQKHTLLEIAEFT